MSISAPRPAYDMASEASVAQEKRLTLNLSESVHSDLKKLAYESSRTVTDIVRLALGLVKIAIEEKKKGNRLFVTSADGKPVKEIVMP